LGCATLEIVEHERDFGIDVRARRGRVGAKGAAVDVDATCGEYERLEPALRAGG
jgi:hypothetical protein